MAEALRVCMMVTGAVETFRLVVFAPLGNPNLLGLRSRGRTPKRLGRRAYLDEREEDRIATPAPSPVPSATAKHMTMIPASVRMDLNLGSLPDRDRLDRSKCSRRVAFDTPPPM